MTVSRLPADFPSRLRQLDARISANLELIPVPMWGFDERATEMLRNRKHSLVNQTLGIAAQRKLPKAQKQKIAKNLGGVPQTVGEVFRFVSGSSLAAKLRKGPTAWKPPPAAVSEVKEEEETKENTDSTIDPHVLEVLKRKGVGRRVVTKRKPANVEADVKPAVPFKKPKQHKPLTDAQKAERREKRKQNRQKKEKPQKSEKNAEIKTNPVEPVKTPALEVGSLSFSKLDFVLKADEPKKRRDKFGGRDYAGLLKKVQKRKEHVEQVRERDPEKAEQLERNIKFEATMKRAQGEKVKDNLDKLAKAVKRKEKTKLKRKAQWTDRTKKVDDDQKRRQEKRQENIDKRRDDKVKKKLGRARKKGRLV